MTAQYFVSDDVDRIVFGEDWVDIRRKMNYGAQQRLVASYVKSHGLKAGLNLEAEFDVSKGNITLLALNIVQWSFCDEKGQIVPITEEYIAKLDITIAERLVEEINERNPFPNL